MRIGAYLSPARWRRGARMLWTWALMPRRIQREPLSTLLPRLTPPPSAVPPRPDAVEEVAALAGFVLRLRLPLDNTCLTRSLTLFHCLRAERVPAQIVFGIRPGKELREGHAWLELDGRPLMEPAERMRGFSPIFRHPEP
jgi:hypothetical protein